MEGPPAEAIGECAESSECDKVGAPYCVFTMTPGEGGPQGNSTWEPSYCGPEADCNAGEGGPPGGGPGGDEGAVGQPEGGEGGPPGPKSFCLEFSGPDGKPLEESAEVDSSIKLFAASMTASIVALALSM